MVLTPAAGLPSGRAPQPWATTRARKPDTGARWWFTVEGPGHPPGGPANRTRPGAPPGSPIVAAGGGEVPGEALRVDHYPGGDLPRANPRQDQVR